MTREREGREAGFIDGNSQFLLQLTYQRLFRPFAVLDLAARKLPQAFHRLARGASGDEHASVRINERAGRDKNEFAHSFSVRKR